MQVSRVFNLQASWKLIIWICARTKEFNVCASLVAACERNEKVNARIRARATFHDLLSAIADR